MLRQSDTHVSGQELCERLGVSRTAVWKNIRQLQEEGYQIEAVRNKGYRMIEAPVDVFNASEIKKPAGGEQPDSEGALYGRDRLYQYLGKAAGGGGKPLGNTGCG